MEPSKVWYVTGASQGLGLSLVKRLLSTGYRVAATSRNAEALKQAVGPYDEARFLPIAVDLNDTNAIQKSVDQTITYFGRIDVVVNNAGYGMAGTLEEISSEKIAEIINVNILSTINVTKIVLPYFRVQRSGYFINISSVAGFAGAPGWAIYSATKAAVTAFSEVLALDVKELGIKVTSIEPSGFRTGFLSDKSLALEETNISEYTAVRDTQLRYLSSNGKQAGDPDRAAKIFIELAESNEPPVRLLLGVDAYNRAAKKIDSMKDEIVKWRQLTSSADFPQ
jgi:short-subunit dehydrogenase